MNNSIVNKLCEDVREGNLGVRAAVERAFLAGSTRGAPYRVGMTKQQRDLLAFINSYTAENGGACPSFEEMMKHMGLKSKSGIHRIVVALEERGLIYRLPNRARSIAVLGKAA